MMAHERKGHTLQPTALVHEAIVRVLGLDPDRVKDTEHFFLLAVGQMRRLLVSHARGKGAKKRCPQEPLAEMSSIRPAAMENALLIDQLMDRLQARDERAYAVVLLRFYGGLSDEETAAVLKMAKSTVRREWDWARAWMLGELKGA